jgi:hypothetical protein
MDRFRVNCLRIAHLPLGQYGNEQMNHIAEILEDLERRDIHKVWKHGITEDLERQLESLCAEYRNGSPSGRGALTTASNLRKATNRAQWFLRRRSFSSHMATHAMQRKDRVALSSGIIALHLWNVANIEYRDSWGTIARLAYAAQPRGLELAEYTTAVCPDVSLRLMETTLLSRRSSAASRRAEPPSRLRHRRSRKN